MKKKYILLFILLLSSLGYISGQTIVSTTPENKNAIVEESTGIHCSYCPDGHAMLNQIIDQNPNDVFVIKFHEGGYAWDCDPNGGHDFNNALANQLGNMAAPNGQPSASINRQVFSNYSMTVGGTAMGRGYWNTAISQVLQESAYVNVGIEAEINANVLTVHVEAYYTASSPQSSNFLHIAITQDETIGPQLGATDFNPSYVASSSPNSNYGHNEYDYRHMDRLVDMIDGISGDEIATTSTGSFIDRTYTYTIPDMYNDVPVDLAEIEVTAFITGGDEIINGYKVQAAYTPLAYDIAVVSIDSPSTGVLSNNENIIVTLENFGENTVSNFDISYQVNGGNTVTESFTGSLAYNETSQFTFYTTYDFSAPGDYEILASTSMTNDENSDNDSSSTSFTSVAGGDCPDEYSLPIVWRDNFECHTEFAISDIGDWVMYDLDGGTTWGANAVDFTNESYVGTGIIYNQELATGTGGDISAWDTYEGNQGLYFFASGANGTTFPNDDWMISPEFTLSGVTSPTFSMWAKSVNDTYGLERFQVGVGNSTDYNDFTIISEGTYIEAPTNWTQYQFDLSQYEGQTIRIAIHYMANDSFVLQTDSYTVDGTLGIEDSVINNFEYFYNVSSKTLEMTSDETLRKIQIFNILGQKVFEENINSNVHTSNLTDLGTSIYIVNIEGTTGVKSFKLLIQ